MKTTPERNDSNAVQGPVRFRALGRYQRQRIGLFGGLSLLAPITAWVVLAQTVPRPILLIQNYTNDQFHIIISNGVSYANYEIYWYDTIDLLQSNTPSFYAVGDFGQTDFLFTNSASTMGFFKASSNTNWDGDAFPNWIDANPAVSNIGILTIKIEGPTNWATIY